MQGPGRAIAEPSPHPTPSALPPQPCKDQGEPSQTFVLGGSGEGSGLADGSFYISTAAGFSGVDGKADLCMQPQLEKLPHVDAVRAQAIYIPPPIYKQKDFTR